MMYDLLLGVAAVLQSSPCRAPAVNAAFPFVLLHHVAVDEGHNLGISVPALPILPLPATLNTVLNTPE
jgi:hypothetical protein